MKSLFRFFILSVIISLVTIHQMKSQSYIRFSISDGLSSDEVTSVCQDKNYYWIGTTDGLCRYDGENFKTYRKGQKDGPSSNNIETLMIDSQGKIWIGYKTKGVDAFCPVKDKFYSLASLTKDITPHHVISIYEDSEKNIWLGSWEEGIFKVTSQDFGKSYSILNNLNGYTVTSIFEKPKGYLWVGTYYGGFVYNLKRNTWQNFSNNSTISSINSETKNSIYYSTWDKGIFKVDFQILKDSIYLQKEIAINSLNDISKMILSDDGSLIVGTWGNGVIIIGNEDSNKNIIPTDEISKNNYIDDISTDNDGNIWISTYGNGLLKLPNSPSLIKKIKFTKEIHSPISEIYQLQNEKIIIGTRGEGSYIYNFKTNSIEPIAMSKKGTGNAYLLKAFQTNDLILLGDDDWGISYNKEEKAFEKTLYYKNQLAKVSSIYCEDNIFWLGTKQNGFFSASYNTETNEFENLKQYDIVGRDEITGFMSLDENRIWISSHNGLFLFNHKTNKIENYAENPIKESVYQIVKAPSSNIIWLATSSGVFYIDPAENNVKSISSHSVLPAGAVKTMKMDSGHNLWFSIGNQLFCYKKSDSYLFEVNLKKIILSPIISSEIIKYQHQEYLLLGSTEGVTSIDLNGLFKNRNQSRVIFTDLAVDLRKVQVGDTIHGNIPLSISTENIQELDLSYKCKWISFHFSSIGDNVLKNQYQYRIIGFSDEWKSFDITQPITISQFHAGNYTFEIQRYNGEKSAENIIWRMDLNIIPPFWQTVWFTFLVISLLVIILGLTTFFTLRKYRQKVSIRISNARKHHELELLKEKESFFMGLSHDILTPFMLIQSPAKDLLSDPNISEENKEKAKIIHKNANFLSNMFSTILDFKKTKDDNLDSNISEFELISFAQTIKNSFEYLARSKNIELTLHSNTETLCIKTDKVKLERVLYNLLSNALKYTLKEGKVSLEISKNIENIEFKIKDTGIGIAIENQEKIFEKFYQEERMSSPEIKNLGLGLYIVKNFITQIGGKITLNSKKEEGTTICFILPADIIIETKNLTTGIELTEKQIKNISESSKPVLLLVEDNEELSQYLAKALSEYFYVITAKNGIEALALAKEIVPEIIISDLMMPEMDGLDLCRKIKEDELLSDSFFVLLTAKNSSEDEVLSYKEGVDVFIKKPIDVDTLLKQMINIVSTRLKRRKQIMHTLLLQKGDMMELSSKDSFIREVMKVVEENMVNPDFKLDDLAEQIHLSKTVLHRKFKDILDETPNQFIRNVRLKKAENLLLNSDLTIAEIAYLTGFNHSHYFIKCFKEVYEETPKNYRQNMK